MADTKTTTPTQEPKNQENETENEVKIEEKNEYYEGLVDDVILGVMDSKDDEES